MSTERYYIATFFTHYDALCFSRELDQENQPKLMPVPRRLSSSCGTCVRFHWEGDPLILKREEIEQLIQSDGTDFQVIWDNR